MIQKYHLHNFKLHDDTTLELGSVTLLTGANGMGKSSVIQSMLMLRESFRSDAEPNYISLSGESFYIGTSANIINWNPTENPNHLEIDINVRSADNRTNVLKFSFLYKETDNRYLDIDKENSDYKFNDLSSISLFGNNFQYLSAFRYGPLETYGSDERFMSDTHQISRSMGRGEYGIYFLERFGSMDIPIAELNYNPSTETDISLSKQVELWLNEIAFGSTLKIDRDGDRYKLKMAYKRHGKALLWVDALNTGFGISYTLSLLTAILSSAPGSLILLENPEAHIHPSAQAGLMRLVSLAANNGVQFIIETHSDHIVNGALVNLKRRIIPDESLKVYFFDRNPDTNNVDPIKLEINEECRIKNGPEGFFTQMQSDMEVLFGFED